MALTIEQEGKRLAQRMIESERNPEAALLRRIKEVEKERRRVKQRFGKLGIERDATRRAGRKTKRMKQSSANISSSRRPKKRSKRPEEGPAAP